MNLIFYNTYIGLYAVSVGKVFRVLYILDDEQLNKRLSNKRGLIAVSCIQDEINLNFIANTYSPLFNSESLPNLLTHVNRYTNLYLKSDGLYFQIAYVSANNVTCNTILRERKDLSVIATDIEGRHYLASKVGVKRVLNVQSISSVA